MAIARLIAPFSQVSGKIAAPGAVAATSAVVAMPDRFGRTLLRNFVNPVQPQSLTQVEAQARLTTISEAYQTLSQPQVEAWQALANSINNSGRLGLDYRLNWNQLFQQVNNYRLQNADSIVLTPPTNTFVAGPSGFSEVTSNDGDPAQQLTFKLTETGTPGASTLRFRVTRNLASPNREARTNELRFFAATFDCFLARVTSAPYNYVIDATTLNVYQGSYIGIEIITLNADYIPQARLFITNTQVQAP